MRGIKRGAPESNEDQDGGEKRRRDILAGLPSRQPPPRYIILVRVALIYTAVGRLIVERISSSNSRGIRANN